MLKLGPFNFYPSVKKKYNIRVVHCIIDDIYNLDVSGVQIL